MTQINVAQAMQAASSHHQAGQLAQAESIYRQITSQLPNHPEALYRLAAIIHQRGDRVAAIDLIRRAIAASPRELRYYHALAEIYQVTGQPEQAIVVFRTAIQLQPDSAENHFGLAGALYQAGNVPEALAAYASCLRIRPDLAEAHYNIGCILHAQRLIDQAIAAYQQAIRTRPTYACAHNNLGNAFKETGRPADATASYTRATEVQPDFADAHLNLGIMCLGDKNYEQATARFSKAIALNPNFPQAHFNLGCAFAEQRMMEQAAAAYSKAIQLRPAYPECFDALGNALSSLKKFPEAIAAFTQAIRLKPDYAPAYGNLGNVLKEIKKLDEAIAAYETSLRLAPSLAVTYYNMAGALSEKKKHEAAIAAYHRAVQLQPDFPEGFYNLGIALYERGRLDEAAAAYAQAIHLKPTFALAHLNLGNVRKDQGLVDEALAHYDRAITLDPDSPQIHSNRPYVVHFHPDYDPAMIREENRRWYERHGAPLRKLIEPHVNTRDPVRRLKIGYLSPDLAMHPIGRFMLPLMEAHDHRNFEITCYSDVRGPDMLSERLRKNADVWRNIVGMSDDQVADLIRADGIDILVDLAMHMTNHRLLVFARKPAPVAVTYLAYCSTTGVETIDYRFTDPYLDPPGEGDEFYCERSVRLAETYWCYDPGMPTPDVRKLAAQTSGYITFGCLNNFCKAAPQTLLAWRDLLAQVPTSRFLLHVTQGSHRERVIELFKQGGIDPARVRFTTHVPMEKYFDLYNEIDIGLDPFPWPGGTTTCDALWMGTPVVSLAGQTAVSRAGLSLLSNLGLPELVARSPEQYIAIAANLAGDVPRLAELRSGLRQRMRESSLMNAPRFARNVEAAYRRMWRTWCGG